MILLTQIRESEEIEIVFDFVCFHDLVLLEFCVCVKIGRRDLYFQIVDAARDMEMPRRVFRRTGFLPENDLHIFRTADTIFHSTLNRRDHFFPSVHIRKQENILFLQLFNQIALQHVNGFVDLSIFEHVGCKLRIFPLI